MISMPFSVKDKDKVVNKVVEIEIDRILPNPYQPRRKFDDELTGLAESIKQNGILQPLTVRSEDDYYILIAGERRLRAAKIAGLFVVPCIIIRMTERNSAVMALVENMQRKDLNYFDEAVAIDKLIDFYGMTQEDAAIKLGKTQSTIANKLRLLKLDERIRAKVSEIGLTERHARALLKLELPEQQLEALENIRLKKLNVEATEHLIATMINKNKEIESIHRRSGAFKDVRIFVNTINKAVEMMKAAGNNADTKKIQENDYIEHIVRIPTKSEM